MGEFSRVSGMEPAERTPFVLAGLEGSLRMQYSVATIASRERADPTLQAERAKHGRRACHLVPEITRISPCGVVLGSSFTSTRSSLLIL